MRYLHCTMIFRIRNSHFDLYYLYSNTNIHYLDRTIEFETGSFQVQKVGLKPITTFEVSYQGTGKQLKALEEF